jgi:hypothetical protein
MVNTIIKIRAYNVFGDTKYRVDLGSGDGVVPTKSADFNDTGNAKNYYFQNVGHVNLLVESKEVVKDIILGSPPDPNKYPIDDTKVDGYHIDIECPVNVRVFDEHGNMAGLDENGILVNNIPGLAYVIMGQSKALFVSDGLNVRFEIDGYDEGYMNLSLTKYEDDFKTKVDTLQHVKIKDGTNINFNFSGSITDASTVDIEYDLYGNGQTQILNPNVELSLDEFNDLLPPTTTVEINNGASNEWYSSDVTVELNAIDDGKSGVLKIFYQINDGEIQEYLNPIKITKEGINTLIYYSADKAGNYEVAKEITVNIDKTKPELAIETSPQPNANGWNNTNVGIKFIASDALSGIVHKPADRLITNEGSDQTFSGEVIDKAGNKISKSITLNIDKSSPQSLAEVTGDQRENGWFFDDVTVTLMGTDNLSGISFIEYSLDHGNSWIKYESPIQLSKIKFILYFTSKKQKVVLICGILCVATIMGLFVFISGFTHFFEFE